MNPQDVTIVPLQESFLDSLVQSDGGPAWNGGMPKWSRYLAETIDGSRYTLVAFIGETPVGYGSLIFHSKYRPFDRANIPELSDLVVSEDHRGEGIATRIIEQLEQEAARRGYKQIGLGVGLYADYGSAQRLYARLGYTMDGNGITAGENFDFVVPGSTVKVDDDLNIWLTKTL